MNSWPRMQAWFLQPTPKDRVQGYLQQTQATALHALLQCQAQAQLKGALAEIGIYHGKTLIGLIRAANEDERVLGIDPLKIGSTDITPMLEANLMEHLTSDELNRLKVRRNFSTDLSTEDWTLALGMPARFVHLDGHHAHSTMLHDLKLAGSSLVEGGLVVIDDFLNELHPGLTAGILEALAAQTLLEPVAVIPRIGHIEEGGSKLVCTTKGHGKRYVECLDAALSDHLRPGTDELLGNSIRVYRSSKAKPPTLVKKRSGKALPVVFALHDANGEYWLNAAVAMTSAGLHASAPLHFHVLHNETLHIQAKERLLAVAQSLGHEISFHFVTLPEVLNDIDLHRFSPASLYRLMIPQLFAQEEAVVYLDADLVCHGVDVHALVQLTPPNKAMGGVIDPHIDKASKHHRVLAALQMNASQYINSGVLVIRPPLIRDDLLTAFALFIQRFPNALNPDQDFLNLIFSSRIERLPDYFNSQVGVYENSLFQPLASYNNKIIHYAGRLKPLDGNLAPAFLVFWMYAMLVPEIAHLNPNMRYVRPIKDTPNAIVREPVTRGV